MPPPSPYSIDTNSTAEKQDLTHKIMSVETKTTSQLSSNMTCQEAIIKEEALSEHTHFKLSSLDQNIDLEAQNLASEYPQKSQDTTLPQEESTEWGSVLMNRFFKFLVENPRFEWHFHLFLTTFYASVRSAHWEIYWHCLFECSWHTSRLCVNFCLLVV